MWKIDSICILDLYPVIGIGEGSQRITILIEGITFVLFQMNAQSGRPQDGVRSGYIIEIVLPDFNIPFVIPLQVIE